MQEDRNSGRDPEQGQCQSESNDAEWQGAVLALIWDEHPDQFSESELIREAVGEHPDFRERDGCERAIESLIREGLLQRSGSLVILTRAARSFARLELD